MKLELRLAQDFGSRLADGMAALEYRRGRVEPYVDICEEIVFDFSDVRSANSSFINALVSGVVEQHGERVLDRIVFKGCTPVIRVLVESAIDLGMQKIADRITA